MPSHMAVGNSVAPGLELVTLTLSIDLEFFTSVNLIEQGRRLFLKGQRKDSPELSSPVRKAGIIKPTHVKPWPKTDLGRQAGRKTDEQTAEHQRMENYQGSTISWAPLISQSPGTNYCGIIGSPQRPDELQAL